MLASVPNFRDLGGLKNRSGRRLRLGALYRSDVICDIAPDDRDVIRGRLGIRELVDLRSSIEHQRFGAGELANPPLRVHHLPVIDGEAHPDEHAAMRRSLGHTYLALAKHRARGLARVLRALARFESNTVFFCAAGKDRTGMVAALVLGLLDVPEEQIVADYAETHARLDLVLGRLARLKGVDFVPGQLQDDAMSAKPANMELFLDGLRDEYGGIEGYVEHIGVSADVVARLRARLLE